MCGTMGVRAEVFPVAADPAGLYDLAGKEFSWESGVIQADSTIHWAVWETLRENSIPDPWVMELHSTEITEPGAAWPSAPGPQYTSWRQTEAAIFTTYVAAIRPPGQYVLDTWPDAEPISRALADVIDRPPSHEPTARPVPRNGDVLFHLLRHVKFLLETDDRNAEALGPLWKKHLEPFTPVLTRMYHRKPEPAA